MSSFDQLKLEQIDTNQPANLELLEQEQVKGTVFVLLANLPENQQEVIRLKFQHGLSYREISDVTKLSETNVGFLIHTGMKELRQKLKTSL